MTNFEAIKSAMADMDLDALAEFCYNYPNCYETFSFHCEGKLLCDRDFSCIECFKLWLCKEQNSI